MSFPFGLVGRPPFQPQFPKPSKRESRGQGLDKSAFYVKEKYIKLSLMEKSNLYADLPYCLKTYVPCIPSRGEGSLENRVQCGDGTTSPTKCLSYTHFL